jgi:hypothetical protein
MKTQRWNVALVLAFCFIAPGSAICGPTSIRPATERILVTRPIAWTGYPDNSYDHKGIVASWENAVIFLNGIYYLSSPVIWAVARRGSGSLFDNG